MTDKEIKGQWDSRGFRGEINVGVDDTMHHCPATAEQAKRFLAGELDYCDGCMALQPAFDGEHCAGCEAECQEETRA